LPQSSLFNVFIDFYLKNIPFLSKNYVKIENSKKEPISKLFPKIKQH